MLVCSFCSPAHEFLKRLGCARTSLPKMSTTGTTLAVQIPRELVVEKILEFIAHELELPVAKLRPSDGFGTDLRITRQWEPRNGRRA